EVATADQAPGTVAQVLQPGYTIAERLLRPALVAVAKAPANGPAAPGGDAAVDQAGDGPEEPGAAPGVRVGTTA
ncbi:MAG: nucleotide exchange factor GrpE, partial [Acidobacteriota bacterium]